MGMLVEGRWEIDGPFPTKDGHFARPQSTFRDWVTADGGSGFAAQAGRYHLYVAWACPWAHRSMIYRKLKGLEDAITISIVDPFMGGDGWVFSDAPGCIPDSVNGAHSLTKFFNARTRNTQAG